MPSVASVPLVAVPDGRRVGVSRYSYKVDRYRLSSYIPPTEERIAETADCPWRKTMKYIVIWPSVMRPITVVKAIHA